MASLSEDQMQSTPLLALLSGGNNTVYLAEKDLSALVLPIVFLGQEERLLEVNMALPTEQ